MEKAFNFLNAHRDVAFATVDGKSPRIRVFQIMKIEGKELYFATCASKEVYRQLRDNPVVEILAMEKNISVRISGSAHFDVPFDVGREIYLSNPVLQRLYKNYSDLEYFRLPVESLDYYDLTPTPPIFEHYLF